MEGRESRRKSFSEHLQFRMTGLYARGKRGDWKNREKAISGVEGTTQRGEKNINLGFCPPRRERWER